MVFPVTQDKACSPAVFGLSGHIQNYQTISLRILAKFREYFAILFGGIKAGPEISLSLNDFDLEDVSGFLQVFFPDFVDFVPKTPINHL